MRLSVLVRSVFKMATQKPNVVFVLGAPGSGKGTQCEMIVQDFGYIHLSAGELLRQEQANSSSKVGQLIDTYIREGKIVPVEITCGLLDKAMQESGKINFLVDGFPRNKDNLDGWNKAMKEKTNLQFVLFFTCPEEVCVDRCLRRGAEGSGRSDDNVESLKKRFQTYLTSTMPIIDHYDEEGLVKKVSAVKTPEEVFDEVKKLFSRSNV